MDINKLMNRTTESPVSLDFDLQQFWENFITMVEDKDVKEVEIVPGKTITFTGNFYGLLNNELEIPMVFWYPNLRINGLVNSLDYTGFTKIKIINSDVLERGLEFYRIAKKKKESL